MAGTEEARPNFEPRSHPSPSSSPSLSGFRTPSDPPDLRLADSAAGFGRYVSSVNAHSSLPQFYVAVERPQFKLGTLQDLMEMLAARMGISVGICCGTRDVLDALVGAMLYDKRFSLQCLHSDMAESERAAVLAAFHSKKRSLAESDSAQRTFSPSGSPPANSDPRKAASEAREGTEQERSIKPPQPELNILATTDACLPTASLGESPLNARLIINFELPAKKEQYTRRVAAILGPTAVTALAKTSPGGSSPPRSFQAGATHSSGGIVLSFVAAAEVGMLRSLEESLGFIIEEMPINILELL